MSSMIISAGPEIGLARRLDGRLVGRVRERSLLDGLVESAEGGGAAVIIAGEAGVGKTALLTHVVGVASERGLRVLRARGEESEAVLAFAALADLLRPLRERFAELPQVQRQALEVCLALSSGRAAGPMAACAGALGVLASAADEQPLVVLVDDFQWVDPESRQALLFAARRLADERIVMMFAVRDEPGTHPHGRGLPVLRIGGLSVAECGELARELGADISGPVLRSLVELTGGNPLAVLENLAGATGGTGGFEPGRLTLGATLENAWGRVFDELPEDTRHALFIVAADAVSGGRLVEAALGMLRLSPSSLAAAERRGLVRTVDGEIHRAHPLMRPVVVGRTPLWARAAAYRALAAVAGGHLRAWFLAAAATGPDDTVAEALAAAAADARQRHGYGVSARTWRRAAELTADHGLRARRLLRAATDAHLAGDSAVAVAWCQEALGQCNAPIFAAEAELILGRARTWAGDPLPAFDGLVRAAAAIRSASPVWAVALLAEATLPAAMTGRVYLVRQVVQQVEELWEDTSSADTGAGASLTVLARVAEAFVAAGELDRAARYQLRAATLLPSAELAAEQHGAASLAQGDIWTERYEKGRLGLSAVVDRGRRMGAPAILSLALGLSSELSWWTGRWDSAYADAIEALQWAEELNQVGLIGHALSQLSRIAAARGDRERCHAHVERARQEVEPRGLGCLTVCADHIVVGGDVLLEEGFSADGEVCVQWARVGRLRATGGSFASASTYALHADALHAQHGVYLDRGFRATATVRLVGANITGELTCTQGSFHDPSGRALDAERIVAEDVYLDRGFTASGEVRFNDCKVSRQFTATDGEFRNDRSGGYALDCDGLRCAGDVFLDRGFRATGKVSLTGAEIGSQLNCTAGSFSTPGGCALFADGMTTPGFVYLDRGFQATGEVRFARATIGRQLVCTDGLFDSRIGSALDLTGLITPGDVLANGDFRATGEVRMRNADITRDLDFSGALLRGGGGLDARGFRVGGRLIWKLDQPPEGLINLSSGQVSLLDDTIRSWPEKKYVLAGLNYRPAMDGKNEITVDQRLDWLRHTKDYAATAYQQLAEAYRLVGEEKTAENISIESMRDLRKRGDLRRRSRWWNTFLDWTVGYGYRLHRPFLALLVLGLLGALLYYLGADLIFATQGKGDTPKSASTGCSAGYPCFNPVVYSFQLLIPGLDLREATFWWPDTSKHPWGLPLTIYTWVMIVLGWVLATAVVAGITQLFRRR